MSEGPLPQEPDLPGRSVLGFLACGAIVRRSALLSIGGFPSRFGIGGEEEVVALDLAAAGWGLAYVDAVVAHHHPARTGCSSSRRRREIRNELWTAWTRRRLPGALFKTARLANTALRSGQPAALLDAVRGLPWTLRERRPVPRSVERAARSLERRPSRRPKSPAVLREPSANLGGSKAS
jgi:N-acetylglucosaminyl-diphospho-decaprenol L-rhamnosyltransferase